MANALLSRGILLVLMLVELGVVFWLSSRAMSMSRAEATGYFLLYAALNGITLAPLAFVYTGATITSVFWTTAGVFGTMACLGYITKIDLSGMGSFLLMGLWGIVIASILQFFFHSDMFSFVVNVCGVIVFTGLTAWDVQKIKNMGSGIDIESDNFRRVAILGALSLYLDFINLFIMLLRLMGGRNRS